MACKNSDVISVSVTAGFSLPAPAPLPCIDMNDWPAIMAMTTATMIHMIIERLSEPGPLNCGLFFGM